MIKIIQVLIVLGSVVSNLVLVQAATSCAEVTCNAGQICARLPNNNFGCATVISSDKSVPISIRNQNIKMVKNENKKSVQNPPNLLIDPCLSSPCLPKEICRVIPNSQSYVCVNELDHKNELTISKNIHLPRERNSLINKINDMKNVHHVKPEIMKEGNSASPSRERGLLLSAKNKNPLDNWGFLKKSLNGEKILSLTRPISNKADSQNFCDGQEEGDRVPHPDDPHKFISCHEKGDYIIMECPDELFFNSHLDRCDYHQDPLKSGCESNPCHYGNECVDLKDKKYECKCKEGFSGTNCEIAPDFCASNPCGANGVCNAMSPDSPVPYYCKCFNNSSYGSTCDASNDKNPCDEDSAHMLFETKMGANLFIHCDHDQEFHLKFCSNNLVFSAAKQECDWEENVSN